MGNVHVNFLQLSMVYTENVHWKCLKINTNFFCKHKKTFYQIGKAILRDVFRVSGLQSWGSQRYKIIIKIIKKHIFPHILRIYEVNGHLWCNKYCKQIPENEVPVRGGVGAKEKGLMHISHVFVKILQCPTLRFT